MLYRCAPVKLSKFVYFVVVINEGKNGKTYGAREKS